MCDSLFDSIFQYIQSIYTEAENSFNIIFDVNDYLENI